MKHTTAGIVCTALLITIFIAPAGPRAEDSTASTPAPATMLLSIRNARIPMDGVLSGGQPSQEQIEAAARAGFRTVINMRGEDEPGFEWEHEAVEGLGMKYVLLPVTGKESLTREKIERFGATLREAREAGPVLLHCASGNRIGVVLALHAAWVEELDAADALKYGQASGMTRAEDMTRELLGLPPSEED